MAKSVSLYRAICLAAAGFGTAMAGCQGPIYTPMAMEALSPPPNLTDEITATRQSVSPPTTSVAFNPQSGSLNGAYRGQGRIVRNPGGTCQLGMPVYGMQVTGDRVHFGSFNGTIQPNGVVEMVFRENWVIGRFDGPHFTGRWISPACSYELVLNRES